MTFPANTINQPITKTIENKNSPVLNVDDRYIFLNFWSCFVCKWTREFLPKLTPFRWGGGAILPPPQVTFFHNFVIKPGENYQESESQTSTFTHGMPQGILLLVTSIFRLVLKQHFMFKIFINLYCKMHWSAKAIFTTFLKLRFKHSGPSSKNRCY